MTTKPISARELREMRERCEKDEPGEWAVRSTVRLLALVERSQKALREFEDWADGYLNKRTGMGAGLHQEKWPSLNPSATKEMLRIARAALVDESGEENK